VEPKKPLQVVERLLRSAERAVVLSLVMALQAPSQIGQRHAIRAADDLAGLAVANPLAEQLDGLAFRLRVGGLSVPPSGKGIVKPPRHNLPTTDLRPVHPPLTSHGLLLVRGL